MKAGCTIKRFFDPENADYKSKASEFLQIRASRLMASVDEVAAGQKAIRNWSGEHNTGIILAISGESWLVFFQ
ncbi:MAG TPA: hypothetical protein VMF06_18780 [Candidatus Limnocylindria bacterium]|jgi:hypothetical protein|nr:hypothetical protein [Candidatus Limnocylindria bacterium]